MVRITWTFQAVSDLHNIADYISKDSEKYAKLQVIRLRNRTKILSSQTHSGKIVPEIARQNIRELIEGNFKIICKIVSDDRVDILAIHHSARSLERRNVE